jgi:ABC-type glycerol-3-phosphate transport system substrate-binding protein
MKTLRLFSLILPLSLVSAGVLFAGGGAQVSTSKAEEITLFVAHPDVYESIRDLAGDFEKQSGIRLKIETIPESENRTKTNLVLSSKSPEYDVFVVATNDIPAGIKAGWYDPIDKYLPQNYDLSDFPKTLLDLLTFDGHLYGLPIRAETNILMYRKDVFQQLGLKVPSTMDEFLATAKILTRDTNRDGKIDFWGTAARGDPGQSAYSFTYFLKTMGGHYLDRDMKANLNSPQAAEALRLYVELNTKYAPEGAIVYTWDQVFGGIQNGTVGMIIESSIQAGILEDPNKSTTVGKIGYAIPPRGTADPHPDLKCNGYMISQFSTKKDAAAKFIQWATGYDVQKYSFDTYGVAALTRNSVMDYANDKAPYFKAIKDAMAIGDIYFLPPLPETGSIYMATCEAVSGAMAGTISIPAALDAANRKIQEFIDKGGYIEIPQYIKDGHG